MNSSCSNKLQDCFAQIHQLLQTVLKGYENVNENFTQILWKSSVQPKILRKTAVQLHAFVQRAGESMESKKEVATICTK